MAAFIFPNFALPIYIDDLRVSALVGAGAPVARAAVLVMLRPVSYTHLTLPTTRSV